MTITTTLNAIRAHDPCKDGWEKLLAHLGKTKADDEPLPLLTILESNGLEDALWCFRALEPEYDAWARLTLCDLVEPALKYTDDPRPKETLEVARRYTRGEATDGELWAARAADWAAGVSSADYWFASAAWAATAEKSAGAAWSASAAVREAIFHAAGAATWFATQSEQERTLRAALAYPRLNNALNPKG